KQLISNINNVLSTFQKQYIREYIKMKIKPKLFNIIDQEIQNKTLNDKPQYYHIIGNRNKLHYQNVYTIRIASSRTSIGSDKNEYTAYMIVGANMCPYSSFTVVCVKRFAEIRSFALEVLFNYLFIFIINFIHNKMY